MEKQSNNSSKSTGSARQLTDWLTLDDLEAESAAYDAAVASGFTLDRFCSSTFWILPAARHLSEGALSRIAKADGAYVVLARTAAWLHPLEAAWGLACPLVGRDPEAAVELFVRSLENETQWSSAVVTGIAEASPLWMRLGRALGRRYRLVRGSTTRRYMANLEDGIEAFLRRRPASLRRNLERAARRALKARLTFEVEDGGSESFDRILSVERRSWKGLRGIGIDREPMRSFYEEINRRLLAAGLRRLSFARLDGEDVAYIFGGLFAGTYRGLQFSFDERFASLSPGNLCQLEEVRRLIKGGVRRYDLGSEVPYKERWGEELVETTAIVIRK
jgi:hypothetical protein